MAAEWKTHWHPAIPSRITSRSPRSPRTGSAPAARTASTAASERARARTSCPFSRSTRINLRPTNPDPPVTNVCMAPHHPCQPGGRHLPCRALKMFRKLVQAAGVPVVPGSEGVVPDLEACQREAARIGFPVLCKAAGGGGGIGMAAARDAGELEKVFRQCTDRARAAFGREGVYLERYFPRPRHIEVQILGDHHGHLIHGLERECSIQRRHQKVVEEAPS